MKKDAKKVQRTGETRRARNSSVANCSLATDTYYIFQSVLKRKKEGKNKRERNHSCEAGEEQKARPEVGPELRSATRDQRASLINTYTHSRTRATTTRSLLFLSWNTFMRAYKKTREKKNTSALSNAPATPAVVPSLFLFSALSTHAPMTKKYNGRARKRRIITHSSPAMSLDFSCSRVVRVQVKFHRLNRPWIHCSKHFFFLPFFSNNRHFPKSN